MHAHLRNWSSGYHSLKSNRTLYHQRERGFKLSPARAGGGGGRREGDSLIKTIRVLVVPFGNVYMGFPAGLNPTEFRQVSRFSFYL